MSERKKSLYVLVRCEDMDEPEVKLLIAESPWYFTLWHRLLQVTKRAGEDGRCTYRDGRHLTARELAVMQFGSPKQLVPVIKTNEQGMPVARMVSAEQLCADFFDQAVDLDLLREDEDGCLVVVDWDTYDRKWAHTPEARRARRNRAPEKMTTRKAVNDHPEGGQCPPPSQAKQSQAKPSKAKQHDLPTGTLAEPPRARDPVDVPRDAPSEQQAGGMIFPVVEDAHDRYFCCPLTPPRRKQLTEWMRRNIRGQVSEEDAAHAWAYAFEATHHARSTGGSVRDGWRYAQHIATDQLAAMVERRKSREWAATHGDPDPGPLRFNPEVRAS